MCDFKKVSQLRLNQEMNKVNNVLRHAKTNGITQTDNLIKATRRIVAERMRLITTENRIATVNKGKKQPQEVWNHRLKRGKIQSLAGIELSKENLIMQNEMKLYN